MSFDDHRTPSEPSLPDPHSATGLRGLWQWIASRMSRPKAAGALRIVTYHGICADSDRGEAWVPSHYVTQSDFARQLRWLHRISTVVDLRDALTALRSGRQWNGLWTAVTFDDAPANLIPLALPLLKEHDIRATIFAVTSLLEDGGMLPADVRQALRGRDNRHDLAVLSNKEAAQLPPHIRESLRHMNWSELQLAHDAGHWIGAHTITHPILSRCGDAQRHYEIAGSIEAIRQAFGDREAPFAYPNGQINDFDNTDMQSLRSLNVPMGFSGIAGLNRADTNMMQLRRNCVGLYHGQAAFVAEMLGWRDERIAQHNRQRLLTAPNSTCSAAQRSTR